MKGGLWLHERWTLDSASVAFVFSLGKETYDLSSITITGAEPT